MSERSVRVVLTAVTAQYQAAMAKAAATTRAMGAEVAAVGKSTQVQGALNKFGLSTNMVMGGLVAGGLLGAANAAMDFESSFAGIRKTVSGSDAEFAALAEGMRDLSKEIPVNVNELNAIGEAAGQLGVEKANILDFTKVMAELGVTTNLTSEMAASSLAKLANITQMPETEFDRLGSTIVALGNAGASTEADITAMSLRIAGAGHQIGLTEPEILAIGTALSDVGIEAEAGGSAISKTMIQIAREVEMGGDKLALFAKVSGMSAEQFSTAWRTDAAGTLALFIKGLGNMDEKGSSTLATLEALGITEVRMRDALLRSAGAGELLTDSLETANTAWRDNTALNAEAAQRFATTESQIQLAKNAVNDLAIELGQTLLPVLAEGAAGLADFAGLLTEILSLAGHLPDGIVKDILGAGLPSIDFSISSTDILTGGLSKIAPDFLTDWIPSVEFNPLDLFGNDEAKEVIQTYGNLEGAIDAIGAPFQEVADAVGPLHEVRSGIDEAAGAFESLADWAQDGADAIEDQVDAFKNLNAVLTGVDDFLGIESAAIDVKNSMLDLKDAEDEVAATQKELSRLAENGKRGTDKYKAAQRDAARALLGRREAELGVLRSQKDLEASLLSYTDKVKTGEISQREAITAVRAFGNAAGLTRRDVDDLIGRIKGYDSVLDEVDGKVVRSKVLADGLTESQRAVQLWKNTLESIPRNITTTLHTVGTGPLGNKPLYHAGGVVGSTTARRLHSGYGAMRGDEVPAILQRGEVVLSRAQVRAMAADPGGVIYVDARGSTLSGAELEQAVRRGIDTSDSEKARSKRWQASVAT